MDKDITFYTIEYDDEPEAVQIEDLMSAFDKIHANNGRPVGEDFDMMVNTMMSDLCVEFGLKYFTPNNDDYIFFPMSMPEEQAMEAIESFNE